VATYYVAEGGTATDQAKENATSGTYPGGCLSPAGHNNETFSAGDNIQFRDAGGDIRATITPPSGGSSGSPITYSNADEGANINGADVVTGWSDEGGNVWSASFTPETNVVMVCVFDGTIGQRQTSLGAVTSDLDYYYDGAGTFYVYWAGGDPDSEFSQIEISKRDICIRNWYGEDYLTYSGIIAKYSTNANCVTQGCDDVIWEDCEIFGAGRSGLWGSKLATHIVRRCNIHSSVNEHAIYLGWEDADSTGILIEQNWLHDCPNGKGVQFNSSGGDGTQIAPIIRHNFMDGNYIGIGDLSATGGLYYGNVIANMGQSGIGFSHDTDDDPTGLQPSENAIVYNNTIYNCPRGFFKYSSYATGMTIKNNIVSECAILVERDTGDGTMTLDNNRYYLSGGYTGAFDWNGTTYDSLAAYQSASSQDATSSVGDPGLVNPANDDFTLASDSPCIGAGANLGSPYNTALMPSSTWPDGVVTGDQDDY